MKPLLCILAILGFASAQFNPTAQEAILKAHNELRSAIAKGEYKINGTLLKAASNMRKMVLSDVILWKMQFEMRLEDLQKLNEDIQNYELNKATQMAWAEIDLIRCGYSKCGKRLPESKYTEVVVACMYEISAYLSYKQGTTCSSCDVGFK